MMDPKVSWAYDRLWLWNELGELCSLLRWPASGAAMIALLWSALTEAGPEFTMQCLTALGAAFLLLYGGMALSAAMSGYTIRQIDRMLGIR